MTIPTLYQATLAACASAEVPGLCREKNPDGWMIAGRYIDDQHAELLVEAHWHRMILAWDWCVDRRLNSTEYVVYDDAGYPIDDARPTLIEALSAAIVAGKGESHACCGTGLSDPAAELTQLRADAETLAAEVRLRRATPESSPGEIWEAMEAVDASGALTRHTGDGT